VKQVGRPLDDFSQFVGLIETQPVDDAKAIAKRRSKETGSRRCAHESEVREIQLDGACSRSLADNNIELEIFHGRIKNFLDDTVQAVDFIDKQNIAFLEIREYCSQIAGTFEDRTGCCFDVYPKLICDDVRKRRFAEPGRSAEQNMVKGLSPSLRRFNEDLQIFLYPVLSDKVVKPEGSEASIELGIIIVLFWCYDSVGQLQPPFAVSDNNASNLGAVAFF
jgi:hypothetical protein